MIDFISNSINLSALWQYLGPLVGVGFGYLISIKVWDRQKQWELKHDVVLDAVRALADLEDTVSKHFEAYPILPIDLKLTNDAETALRNKRLEVKKHLMDCSASFQRAHTIADVGIGGELSRNLSGYFQCALSFTVKMQSVMNPSDRIAANKELAVWHNRVILSARKALGIKDAGDLPVLDYDNKSLTTDY